MSRTEPLTKTEIQEARTASLPVSISETALQRVSTGRVRFALSQLAQNNVTQVQHWLDAIALVDGPKAALELYLKMIEYSVPKLSRTEIKVEDTDGNTAVAQLTIEELKQLIRDGVRFEKSVVSDQ